MQFCSSIAFPLCFFFWRSLQEDQRVLAADIKRTRQAYAMFKREEVMQLVSQVLERYCVGHGIRYKQGQNELIAPFVMLKVQQKGYCTSKAIEKSRVRYVSVSPFSRITAVVFGLDMHPTNRGHTGPKASLAILAANQLQAQPHSFAAYMVLKYMVCFSPVSIYSYLRTIR